MTRIQFKPSIVLAAFVLAGCASAADSTVEGLLAHMRDSYKGVKSATYTTEVTLTSKADGEQKFTSDFAYMKPNMMRIIIKGTGISEGAVTVISNGEKINVSTLQGSMPPVDFSVENIEKGIPANLESLCFWDWDRQLSTSSGKNMEKSTFRIVKDEEWNGKHWEVLEETATKDNVLCRYFIDPKTYFIWRTLVLSLEDKKPQMDAKLTKLNPSAGLDEAMFKGS